MFKSYNTYLALVIALLFSHSLFSQKAPIKFGKIDKADLEMTIYAEDTSAHAVILCDYGSAELLYEPTIEDFKVRFNRHIRFKILDKAGYDYANFSIPLYQSKGSSDREKISKFKGSTYNLVNGEMIETKVSQKELIKEERSESLIYQKIAMPEIKEGAIFEIQYSISSPFTWNLQDWNFQDLVPTKFSEYRVEYPDWFDYKTNFTGYDFNYLTTNDSGSKTGRINELSVDYTKKKFRWIAEEMPAFKPEEFSVSPHNFLTSVDFELASYQFPNSPYKNFTKTWTDIAKLMRESDAIGSQLRKMKTNFLKEAAATLKTSQEAPKDQIAAIYHNVKQKIEWDGNYSKYANNDLKKVYKEGKGNAAEINLALIAMLQQAGFDARPVAISTRDYKLLNEFFPKLNQFNYLIAGVVLADGKVWLLDATDRSLPINLLPSRCINGKGMMVHENGFDWVELNPNGKYRYIRQVKAQLQEDLTWQGTMNIKCRDYAANSARKSFAAEGSEEKYMLYLENEYEGLNLENASLEEMKTLARETKESFDLTINDQVIDGGNMLYFNPMLNFAIEENPFKLADRKYPIDYNYPHEFIYSASFEIPEEYTIEEVPEKIAIALPEKGGSFNYTTTIQGNTINLTSIMKINKHLYMPQEYTALKEFYNQIIDKMANQVVLKKKT